MMSIVNLLLFVLTACSFFLIICTEAQFNIGKKSLKLHNIGECSDKKGLPVVVRTTGKILDNSGKDKAFNAKITVNQKINDISCSITVWKCRSMENLNSCEYFLKNYRFNDVCPRLKSKRDMWTDFLDKSNIPKTCPIPVGNYTITEVPIDSKFFHYLPIPEAFWKARISAYDSGKLFSCTDVIISVLRDKIISRN